MTQKSMRQAFSELFNNQTFMSKFFNELNAEPKESQKAPDKKIRNKVLLEVIEKLEEEAIHGKDIGRKQCEGMARAINIVRSMIET